MSACSIIALISSSTAAYFFLPTVNEPTMFPVAAATAPTSAEAPPPPGVGALLASTSTNARQLCNVMSSILFVILSINHYI